LPNGIAYSAIKRARQIAIAYLAIKERQITIAYFAIKSCQITSDYLATKERLMGAIIQQCW
jgi:hypothetical protein